MIYLESRFKLSGSKPEIVCELRPHPQGHFKINEKTYRPEWPIASMGMEKQKALEIINLGIDEANGIYKENGKSPSSIRIEIYDNRTRIITRD